MDLPHILQMPAPEKEEVKEEVKEEKKVSSDKGYADESKGRKKKSRKKG